MNFDNRITETQFRSGIPQVSKLSETISARDYGPNLRGVDPDENEWRRLTGAERDLPKYTFDRHLRIAYYLYDTNMLAKRILHITRDFVVGEGFKVIAKDEKVQEVIDRHWFDEINQWDIFLDQMTVWLGLAAEGIYEMAVNEMNGLVRVGYIEPLDVEAIIPMTGNKRLLEKIKFKMPADGSPQQEWDVIRRDEQTGELIGKVFWFPVNQVRPGERGRSDIFAATDWLDGYDQFLFNMLERGTILNTYIWDILFKGKDETWIRDYVNKMSTPKPGSIRGHNEDVTWNAVTPDLKAADYVSMARQIKNNILGGQGFPEHWFAEGGETNLATAVEMGTPTFKMLTGRQRYIKHIVESILRYQIEMAQRYEYLINRDTDTNFHIDIPDISTKDMSKIAASLLALVQGLMLAVQNEFMEPADAIRVINVYMVHVGIEIEIKTKEEIEQVIEENGGNGRLAQLFKGQPKLLEALEAVGYRG